VDYADKDLWQRPNLPFITRPSQLIVESIPTPSYEGAQRAISKLIVICTFGLNKLIELIWASGHQPNSKIFCIFRGECRLFCEGVKATSNGLVSRSKLVDRNDLVDHNGFVGCKDLIKHISLDLCGHNGLNGFISLGVSFIGLGFNGFIGLGLISIARLIGHISLVGLGGFSGISGISGISGLIGQISLVSLIGIIGLIGLICLGNLGITSLVGSSASSTCRLIGLVGFRICSLARIAAVVKTTLWLKHTASHRVAALQISASKIVIAATVFYAASSLHVHLCVMEKMCWWLAFAKKKMKLWSASFGDPYNGGVLHFAKQLFSLSLPQMIKYCVMRECENIHSLISPSVDLVYSQQDGIYGFKFPKRFFGDLFQRSHSFDSLTLLLN
jgi:hypothetical protein